MKHKEIVAGQTYCNERNVKRKVIEVLHDLNEVRFITILGKPSYWERKYPGHYGICTIGSFRKWAVMKDMMHSE